MGLVVLIKPKLRPNLLKCVWKVTQNMIIQCCWATGKDWDILWGIILKKNIIVKSGVEGWVVWLE